MESMRRFLFVVPAIVAAAFLAVGVAQADPINHVPPKVSGIAAPGRTLTASTGTWEMDTTGGVSYAFAWLQCDAAGKACKPLKRNGKQILGKKMVVPRLVSGTIRVTVLASDASGTGAALSAPVKVRAK
jgi:hypothetical protein